MPANDADYQREYMRRYRYEGRERVSLRGRNVLRPFVGCDGEGATLDNGYHAYFMLRIGEDTLATKPGMVRLSTWECLDFITSRDPDYLYVGYFFDYDVTKILEDLPFPKLNRLMNRHLRTGTNRKVFPVDFGPFQIEYLPGKEFKARKRLSQTETETTWSPWIAISDVGTFFQTGFARAIELWDVGMEQERAEIRAGKAKRASFDVKNFDDIARYNAVEIRLLEELMSRFRGACQEAGYVPARWQGPGLLAEAMLKKHRVPQSRDVAVLQTKPELVAFALNAYYGGRTEVAAVGPVNQPVWQYDINSAYPYAMQFVPCLVHGEWEHYETGQLSGTDAARFLSDLRRPTGAVGERYALMYGSFKLHGSSHHPVWYGLPIRTHEGTIVYPQEGSGWYWSFEVESAVHQSFTPTEAWLYRRVCSCAPLSFVKTVYETRKRIGKDGPGIVLKLGMNSLYGKTVQSIGFPKYANPIWGSFITAYPRMMIQDFLHSMPDCEDRSCGQRVLMVATDSVTSTAERTEDEYCAHSGTLGGWSTELHPHGMFIVQPGVYFGSSGKPSKTRGVPRTIVDPYEVQFRDGFAAMVRTGEMSAGSVRVPQQLFVGIRYALHRRNTKLLGQWIDFGEGDSVGKEISFDWTSKRVGYPALKPNEHRSYIQTFPYRGSTEIESVPYSRDIGGLLLRDELRMAFEGQPDWMGVIEE